MKYISRTIFSCLYIKFVLKDAYVYIYSYNMVTRQLTSVLFIFGGMC